MSLTAAVVTDEAGWQGILAGLPEAHLLQSYAWGEFKARHGWAPIRLAWRQNGRPVAAASVLRRAAPWPRVPGLPACILYVPRGPVLDWSDAAVVRDVLGGLEELARRERAIFIKVDPAVVTGRLHFDSGIDQADPAGRQIAADLAGRGWKFSDAPVQFSNTLLLDLNRPEEEILSAMKQKTRYNIRLAARKGVHVRLGGPADLDLLYRLYAETSARDGFVIRAAEYYRDAWGSFMAAGLAQPFVAEVEGVPVSAIIVFRHGARALYMYGMSREAHRDKMPNHLLQWEAIRWARARGCAVYDFWGAPTELDETDPLWGVWRFKEGFGAEYVRTVGAWDFVAAPLAHRLYASFLPRLLHLMRRRAQRQTQAQLEA